jgi:hypothetical protein
MAVLCNHAKAVKGDILIGCTRKGFLFDGVVRQACTVVFCTKVCTTILTPPDVITFQQLVIIRLIDCKHALSYVHYIWLCV